MSIAEKLKSALSVVLSGVILASAIPMMPTIETDAASTCVINTENEYQTIKGFGGINHPEWTGQDLTDSQRQTAFGNADNELGFSVLRVFVNPDKNQWYKAVDTAKAAQAQGATIFASPWEPPSSLAESGGSSGKLHLNKNNYEAYANHLNDFVQYMKSQGVNIYAISIQNEPDYAHDWTAWTSDETTDFLANYGHLIDCRVMSPETFQYTNKDYYTKILDNDKAFANTDLFATHMYGTQRSQMDFPALESCGKEIWMTEVYVPNSEANSNERWPEAIQVAENMHNALVVGNMSAYVWWYIRRNYGPMNEDGSISKRGYMMAQYSKYVRPGDVRIDVTEKPTDNVYVSAYKSPDNDRVTIVAVNNGTEGYAQEFSLGGEKISDIDRYRTSANENLAETQNLEYSGDSFFAQLPGQSVSTFVVSLSEEPVDPDENGYFFHSTFEDGEDSWTGHGSSTVLISGRTPYSGTEALLVQERASAWNGVERSLKANTFVPGNEYSFSANVIYLDGNSTQTFFMKLQYTGSDGETHYASVAEATAVKGAYVQLANTNYKIPADATDMRLYIETESGTNNFYIDDAIGAVAGTQIEGPDEISFMAGDINSDGFIDCFDTALARTGLVNGFANSTAALAADVDQSGEYNVADLVQIQKFVLGMIGEFSITTGTVLPDETTPSLYMDNIKSMMTEYAANGSADEKSGVEYGTLTKYQYYSTTRERMTNVNVLLPPGYNENETYPVLYALHGFWENEDSLADMGKVRNMLGNLIASGDAEKMIVVFPYIYTSKTQETCSGLDLANSLNYDNFINDLITDLMPYINSNFSVRTGRENTAITGFSMGARESLFIGLTRSDLFGYVGAACPAPGLTPGSDLSLHPGQLQESQLKPAYEMPDLIMITAGGNDSVVSSSPSAYDQILSTNNVEHLWHFVSDGQHNYTSVQPHFYNYLRAIFKA